MTETIDWRMKRYVLAYTNFWTIWAVYIITPLGIQGSPFLFSFSQHPVWRPHLFQGWATDFIPRLMTNVMEEFPDLEVMPTSGFDAMDTSREMAKKEGIFSGTSGGGIVSAALKIAKVIFQEKRGNK